jgi:hypothetical protein
MRKALLKQLNHTLSWHDREIWDGVNTFLDQFFTEQRDELTGVVSYARTLSARMAEVSSFIQQNTSVVCPGCEKVCCVNRHGYYDHPDLIYIHALGLRHPEYREGMADMDPCQFLSVSGCTLKRSVRPFRCNWYFCAVLLAHMENGPAKPYREFVNRFQEIIGVRRRMLELFAATIRVLARHEKELFSLYTNMVKS